MGFLNEGFQGPSEKGEGDCRVLVMEGGGMVGLIQGPICWVMVRDSWVHI